MHEGRDTIFFLFFLVFCLWVFFLFQVLAICLKLEYCSTAASECCKAEKSLDEKAGHLRTASRSELDHQDDFCDNGHNDDDDEHDADDDDKNNDDDNGEDDNNDDAGDVYDFVYDNRCFKGRKTA